MKIALSSSLLACLVAATLSLTGCASDFSGEDSDAPPADPVVGLGTEGNPHWKGGKSAAPSFNDLGLALKASGAVAGLGNGDVTVDLSAAGKAFSTCTNPGGGTQPPGQNPADVTLSGTQAIPASEIKNGALSFSLSTGGPAPIVEGAPGCPGSNWTQAVTDVSFSSAHITIKQNGSTVLDVTCTFSPSTANGAVPARNVTCS